MNKQDEPRQVGSLAGTGEEIKEVIIGEPRLCPIVQRSLEKWKLPGWDSPSVRFAMSLAVSAAGTV